MGGEFSEHGNHLGVLVVQMLEHRPLDADGFVGPQRLGHLVDRPVDRRCVVPAYALVVGEPFPQLNFTKWHVSHDGERVGKVTSAVHSPRLKRNIGYAWLPVELARDGFIVDVATEWGDRTATVVPMPFVDPEKAIPSS